MRTEEPLVQVQNRSGFPILPTRPLRCGAGEAGGVLDVACALVPRDLGIWADRHGTVHGIACTVGALHGGGRLAPFDPVDNFGKKIVLVSNGADASPAVVDARLEIGTKEFRACLRTHLRVDCVHVLLRAQVAAQLIVHALPDDQLAAALLKARKIGVDRVVRSAELLLGEVESRGTVGMRSASLVRSV
jgi:hypothetical protein